MIQYKCSMINFLMFSSIMLVPVRGLISTQQMIYDYRSID